MDSITFVGGPLCGEVISNPEDCGETYRHVTPQKNQYVYFKRVGAGGWRYVLGVIWYSKAAMPVEVTLEFYR